ncbi:N-6 DNA methylase, partial [Candidatus Saccharibacteria bacterium]|nr:N-6 DNA methylase [Candidatus Saccharibacteria bacterium]
MALPPTFNDMRIRAKEFVNEHQDDSSERGEAQTFWNDFFQIFGIKRQSVGIYEQLARRLGKAAGFIDMFWPGVLIVEHKSRGEPLEPAYDQATDYTAELSPDDHPRYIIVSDFQNIKLYDLQTIGKQGEWTISLEELPQKLDLFGFIAGYNKQEYVEQHPVDIKASKQLTKIHNELKQTGYGGQDLEILLVRLLFCMFAEDNGVFDKGIFYDYIYSRTEEDAADLGPKLVLLFETLDKPINERQTTLDEYLQRFPYVNGNLFKKRISTPTFNHNMRHSLLDAARNNDWSQINPAIFGAMFQNVMQESGTEKRRELGAHYTSEINIQKVIKPLFLDTLRTEFEESKHQFHVLSHFHDKLASLKFLDPACGCGNFLVVAYRELRRLELDVLKILYGEHLGDPEINLKSIVKCNVNQFYGIEFEEFPSQVAQVALWLTDAQMNNEAQDVFHKPLVRLPLISSATIIHGDALELDWQEVLGGKKNIIILGNPPFSGGKQMTQFQRDQVKSLFPNGTGAGVLDFVAGWYAKAIEYIKGTDIKVAFVSTNSIAQGEQVGILWKYLLEYGAKINFAHKTFRWSNEASGKAAVYCVIIGFSLEDYGPKRLYEYATP